MTSYMLLLQCPGAISWLVYSISVFVSSFKLVLSLFNCVMVYCKVVGCKSDSNRKDLRVSWHRFPKDDRLRRQWISRINRLGYCEKDWLPSHVICGLHFVDPDDFVSPSPSQAESLGYKRGRFDLKTGVIPSVKLGKEDDPNSRSMCDKLPPTARKKSLARVKRENLQVS